MTTPDTGIGVMLIDDPNYMSIIALHPDLMTKLREHIKSTQSPIIFDLDSVENQNFQFVLCYTLMYSSRGEAFFQWAKDAINIEQLTRQFRIHWTNDWGRDNFNYDGREVYSFDADYTELAKLFWAMAGRTEPIKRLTMFRYLYKRGYAGEKDIYTTIQNSHPDDASRDNSDTPTRRKGGDNITMLYGERRMA